MSPKGKPKGKQETKAEKKPAKAVAASKAPVPAPTDAPQVDLEELEEQQEEAAASASNSNAAALAAASGSTEMSASFKNFRHHPDMENFYRFIYDNDLRHEALAIIDEIMTEKQKRRQVKSAKLQAN